jgi:aldehyde dehydrogenase (NAD+)
VDEEHVMQISSPHLSERATALLAGTGTYAGGTWRNAAGPVLDVIDPSDGQVVGHVAASTTDDVHAAVSAARSAFDDGRWSGLSPAQRSAALHRLTDVLTSYSDVFVEIGTLEVGTPLSLSRGLHSSIPLSFFRWWAETALSGPMGGWQESLGLSETPVMTMSTLFREPIGVVAAISAYNFPLLITSFKVGGALAAGCTAVLHPSPRTVLSAIAFIHCVEEAGLPPGAVNLVIGEAEVGEALSLADGVDLVTFTGSVAVGKKVMEQASRGLKHVVLELGGKSPNILLPGTDLETVVGPSILRYTRNAGQGCGATTRTIVPHEMYDEYAAAAKAFLGSMAVGSAWEEATQVGPVIRADHRDRIEGYVTRALDQGATLLAGGGRPDIVGGFYLNPALIGNVDPDAEICQEELFGPIGVLIPYDSVEEAIAIANGTRYGLNANVWGPTDEAMRVARRLKAGTVTLNGGGADLPQFPWPSAGESGVGVDRGMEGFREFFKLRHVQIPLSRIGR